MCLFHKSNPKGRAVKEASSAVTGGISLLLSGRNKKGYTNQKLSAIHKEADSAITVPGETQPQLIASRVF